MKILMYLLLLLQINRNDCKFDLHYLIAFIKKIKTINCNQRLIGFYISLRIELLLNRSNS